MPILPGVSIIEDIGLPIFDGYVRSQRDDLEMVSGLDLDMLAAQFGVNRERTDGYVFGVDGDMVRNRYAQSEDDRALRRRILNVIENPASYTYTIGGTYARSMANPAWAPGLISRMIKYEDEVPKAPPAPKSSWARLGTLDIDNHTVSRRSMNARVLEPIL
jgi:hypothetical protein